MKKIVILVLLCSFTILLSAQTNQNHMRLLSPGNNQISEDIYSEYPVFYFDNANNYMIRIIEINEVEVDNALIYSCIPFIEDEVIGEYWQYPNSAEKLKSGKMYAWYLYNDSLRHYSEILYFKKISFVDKITNESLLNLLINNFPDDENIQTLVKNGFKPTGKILINGIEHNVVSFSIFLNSIINKDISIITGIINEED